MAHKKGEGPATTIENDPEFLAGANGILDPSEAPPIPAKSRIQRPPPRPGDYTAPPETSPVSANLGEATTVNLGGTTTGRSDQVTSPPSLDVRPGNYDQLPAVPSVSNRNRVRGEAVVEIEHQFRTAARQVVPTYIVQTPAGTQAFEFGLPFSALGVPVETGRRYRVTIVEELDSVPAPKRIPFSPGQSV